MKQVSKGGKTPEKARRQAMGDTPMKGAPTVKAGGSPGGKNHMGHGEGCTAKGKNYMGSK